MKRRTVLNHIGAAGAAAALAGCVADRPGSDDEDGDSDPDDEPATTDDGDGNESADGNETDDEASGVSSPELTGTDVTTHSAQCGSNDAASISFGDGSVTVEGTITAPDPCHDAEVSAAEYSEADDELSIAVGTAAADADQMCSDCIAEVEYTATASFDGGTPINATVSHETPGDGTKTVAENSRQ